MRRFRFVAVLLSLALAILLVLSISGRPSAEAHDEEADDEIKTNFNLVDNPMFTPVAPGHGPAEKHGEGEIKIDGEDLDKLKFKVEYKTDAGFLDNNTWYYLSVTVREDFGGGAVPVALVVVGMAKTDDEGRLEFKGKGVLPNVFDPPATPGFTLDKWRIDQQVRKLGKLPTNQNNCVECILVCAPTTKVVLNGDGDGLIKFVP